MHNRKLLFAVIIAAATFATPVLAAGHRSRHAVDPNDRAVPMAQRYEDERTDGLGYDGYRCIQAPRVGAFATQPWTDTTPCEPYIAY